MPDQSVAPTPLSARARSVPEARGRPAPQLPAWVHESGAMLWLALTAMRRMARPPFDYGAELAQQLRFVLTVAWFPLIVTSVAISLGPAGIQGSNLLGLFGAFDRLGALYGTFLPREFAPLVVGIVIAGTAGTAVCADLGARKVREELDALAVLGVDPIKGLVVPRLIALLVSCAVLNTFALASGMAGAMLVEIENGQRLGPFFASFAASANPLELGASYAKCLVFGATIAIVCCHKGLRASGGAEGVGRAVNQAVVLSFLLIGAIDYVFSQLLLATHPVLSQVR